MSANAERGVKSNRFCKEGPLFTEAHAWGVKTNYSLQEKLVFTLGPCCLEKDMERKRTLEAKNNERRRTGVKSNRFCKEGPLFTEAHAWGVNTNLLQSDLVPNA